MTKIESKLRQLICKCIEEHKVVWFYYESSSGQYWRKVDPYILAIKDNGNGNIFFTGYAYPAKEGTQKSNNDDQGQYLLNKIDINQFEVLDETFYKLKVDHTRIFGELKTIKIICRVAF